MKLRRLGIRKVLTRAFESKAGQKVDKAVNKVVTVPGTIANKVNDATGINKLKVNPERISHKVKNMSISNKVNKAHKKLEAQKKLDAQAAKDFEKEMEEGRKYMAENGVDPDNVHGFEADSTDVNSHSPIMRPFPEDVAEQFNSLSEGNLKIASHKEKEG